VVQSLVVLAANKTPVLAVQSGSVFFINAPIAINNLINVTDGDDVIKSATVSITSGFQSTEDQLLFAPQNGLTGNFVASTLTMSGAGTVSNYQTALRSVQYNNTSSSPNTNDRIISFHVNDGVVTSNAVTVTITINKPPAIAAPAKDTNAGGNIVFLVNDILSDPDDNLDLSTLKIVSAQGAMITISGNAITVNYSTLPEYEGTDELTITVCDVGGKCETQVVTVDVAADVEVFNGISSNSDGVNDYFKIRFLPPGSRVAIFNRWGDTVYEIEEYDSNDPLKRFEGNSTDGKALVTGTYFYMIELPNKRKRTGYLQIKQ
jgi:gliding motility-associated-like protein